MAAPANLLLHPLEVAGGLRDAARRDDTLNAFLFAAGLSQIVDDYLHPSPLLAIETSAKLSAAGHPVIASAPRAVAAGAGRVRRYGPGARRVRAWKRDVDAIVSETAELTVRGGAERATHLEPSTARVHARVRVLPRALREAVLKVPAGFHAFDLRPDDFDSLVAAFAARYGDRGRPLLVVGVRTSGSYFAPLCAASLRARGYAAVGWLTVRPDAPLHAGESRILRSIAERGGLVLLVDDPPATGRSLAVSAEMLCAAGIRPSSLIVLVPTFDSAPAPAFYDHEVVVLPRTEWTIDSQLTGDNVRAVLEDLWRLELRPGDVDQLPLPTRDPHRDHASALFRVRLRGGAAAPERLVLAQGVGVGWFGEQTLTVARGLADWVPAIHGLRDGVLYREWLPEEGRVTGPSNALAASIAQYVHDRAARFPVDGDRSLALSGRDPAWEVASTTLSRAFARGWPLARLAFMDRAARSLLRAPRASVVDGDTGVREWFCAEQSERRFVKAGFADRSFWHLGLACFDPVFDLAGANPGAADRAFSLELRAAYELLSDDRVDAERWLLYQLAHLWGRRRSEPAADREIQRRLARAARDYVADIVLADVRAPVRGPLCALDVDGVVETAALGFPAPTLQSALALRALMSHGFRPVLVSGRSGADIAERCVSYRLAGGVGEYGAVVHYALTGADDCLLTEEELAVLGFLRQQIAREDGVTVGDDHRGSVRAFRASKGSTRGLEPPLIERVLRASANGSIKAIHGQGQTDFTISRVDKGRGLERLARGLQPQGAAIALAVGDSVSDLPMLRLAERALAPANADAAVRGAGVEVVSKPYQAGLAQGVASLIGHVPGACPLCRAPAASPRTKFVLDVLAAQERGKLGIATSLARLAWSARRL